MKEFYKDENSNVELVTPKEVKKAANAMKNVRAPRLDWVYIELTKTAQIELYEILSAIFDKCIGAEAVPRVEKSN